jgi:hypothetical protein
MFSLGGSEAYCNAFTLKTEKMENIIMMLLWKYVVDIRLDGSGKESCPITNFGLGKWVLGVL